MDQIARGLGSVQFTSFCQTHRFVKHTNGFSWVHFVLPNYFVCFVKHINGLGSVQFTSFCQNRQLALACYWSRAMRQPRTDGYEAVAWHCDYRPENPIVNNT